VVNNSQAERVVGGCGWSLLTLLIEDLEHRYIGGVKLTTRNPLTPRLGCYCKEGDADAL
jgi:hypothetical protein